MLKVFVSSTFQDLIAHRAAVRHVLHRMKADVRAMEYMGSRPDTPAQACDAEVLACDVFVGIYAWSYGWRPRPGGPSITEQEFDVAQRAGKDCLVYVVNPDHPWPPSFIDAEDARTALDAFKERVGVLLRSTFTTPDSLATSVAADIGSLLHDRRSRVTVAPRSIGAGVPTEGLERVADALRQAPVATTRPPDPLDDARYVARLEHFGSLIFDRAHADYIAFDHGATDVFRLSGRRTLAELLQLLDDQVQRADLEQFTRLCQSIDLVDAAGRFRGVFLEAPTPPRDRLSAPLVVHLACTNACNLRCRHCHASSGHPHAGELTTREVFRLIDQLADMGCWRLSIGGGEPLVRADLADIVRRANSRGVSVRLATNAVAATREAVEPLRGLKFEAFKVSLEGTTEPTSADVRGCDGTLQAALDGIARLESLAAPIEIHRVFMRSNAGDLEQLVALADQLGASALVLSTVLPVGRAAAHPELVLGAEESSRLWEQAEALQERTKVPIHTPARGLLQARRLAPQAGCACGTITCHVDPLGCVRPTGMAPLEASAGNVRDRPFRAIWNGADAFAAFRAPCERARCLMRESLAVF